METMEIMETAIEEIKEVAPVEEAQTALEVVAAKTTKKGGIVAAGVVLGIGVGYGIYKLVKKVTGAITAKKESKQNDKAESDMDESEED